jgi:predicted metal-dependent hydrolase
MSSNGQETYRVKYGSKVISFDLEYRQRRTMEISVYPDLAVRVNAPSERTLDEIKDKVKKRASWILEQQHFFSLYLPKQPPRQYVSGESHLYLGKQYRLKTVQSENEKVALKRGCLLIHINDRRNSDRIKELLDQWYRDRAEVILRERVQLCCAKMRKYGVGEPRYQIRRMSKRWGSCSKDGKMILNVHLIKAPSHCIDYVIAHELCHLKYFNHGKAFYTLMTQVMPDWKKRKGRLEQVTL